MSEAIPSTIESRWGCCGFEPNCVIKGNVKMDKLQRAKGLLTDIKYAVESGEGEIPVDNNDSSVVEWLVEQAKRLNVAMTHFNERESESTALILALEEENKRLKQENEQLKSDLYQWKKWYEQATGFPATKN